MDEFLVVPIVVPRESIGNIVLFSWKPLAVVFDFILHKPLCMAPRHF